MDRPEQSVVDGSKASPKDLPSVDRMLRSPAGQALERRLAAAAAPEAERVAHAGQEAAGGFRHPIDPGFGALHGARCKRFDAVPGPAGRVLGRV